MATYLVLSRLHGQPIKRFAAKPRTRLPVPTARRRMFPSQPISVITTLTVASVPAPAGQLSGRRILQPHECRKVQPDARYAL